MSEEKIINENVDIQEIDEKLFLNELSTKHLLEITKWAKFLSIVGFVFIGILVIIGFSMGGIISLFTEQVMPFPAFIFGFLYLIIGAIYFYPLFALLKFANLAKLSVAQHDSENLTLALKNLRGVFTFIGILTIIGVIAFVLEIIGMFAFMPFIMH